jgi:hypothetical protein
LSRERLCKLAGEFNELGDLADQAVNKVHGVSVLEVIEDRSDVRMFIGHVHPPRLFPIEVGLFSC